MNDRNKYTFASVSFANAVPFTGCMSDVCPQCKVIFDPPSKLADMLLQGCVDAALVPVVDLFHNSSLKAVGDIGICGKGETTSTLVKCFKPLHEISVIKEDKASHTSNALAKILFERHFKLDVRMVSEPSESSPDAEVLIGDRAMQSEPASYGDYDLSNEWLLMTGKPFVFAVWTVRDDCSYADKLADILSASLEEGMKNIEDLAERQAGLLGLPVLQMAEYLSGIIHYRLDDDDKAGMQLFREMYYDLEEFG